MSKKPYGIEVHFAGMCLLVTDGEKAEMMLPNPVIVEASNHDPVLLIKDHEGLIGSPDQSITLPGSSEEYGVWSLRGRTVTLSGKFGPGKLDLPLQDLKAGWVPAEPDNPKEWENLRTLPDVGEMAATDKLKKNLGSDITGPVVPIPFGRLSALMPAEPNRRMKKLAYTLDHNKEPLAKPRVMSDRVAWLLPPVVGPVTITLAGVNPATITVDHTLDLPIMISNVAAGACMDHNENHFDVYFELVDPSRRPIFYAMVAGVDDPPHYPEICRNAIVRVGKL